MGKASEALYIPSLDGLRCLAVVLVVASHSMYDAGMTSVIPGNLGVTVFFFLSGYLITTLMRMEQDRYGAISIGKFMIRRALRILPPFYIVFVLALLAGWWFKYSRMDSTLVIGQALHLTNYIIAFKDFGAKIVPGTDVLWSLAVEEHFYILFPWLFVFVSNIGSRQRQGATLLAVCLLFLAWRCWLIFAAGADTVRTYAATDTRADSILFGCVLALWGNPYLDKPRIPEVSLKYVWFPIGLLTLLATLVIDSDAFTSTIRYTLQGLALFPVFVVCIRFPNWGVIRLLNLPFVRWIGLLSYTIYLVHRVILMAVWELLQPAFWLYIAIAVPLIVGFAAAMYYAVEKPIAALRKRYSGTGGGGRLPAQQLPEVQS